MKHLLTVIACCLAVAGSAQTPYNPDFDGNNLIGVNDLTEFLPMWGQEFYPETDLPINYFTTDCCNWLLDSNGDSYAIYDTLYMSNESQFLVITGDDGVGGVNGSTAFVSLPDGNQFLKLIIYAEDAAFLFLPNQEIQSGFLHWDMIDDMTFRTYYRLPTGDWIKEN